MKKIKDLIYKIKESIRLQLIVGAISVGLIATGVVGVVAYKNSNNSLASSGEVEEANESEADIILTENESGELVATDKEGNVVASGEEVEKLVEEEKSKGETVVAKTEDGTTVKVDKVDGDKVTSSGGQTVKPSPKPPVIADKPTDKPSNGGNSDNSSSNKPTDKPSNGGDSNNNNNKPSEPSKPSKPEKPVEPEKPAEPSKPSDDKIDVSDIPPAKYMLNGTGDKLMKNYGITGSYNGNRFNEINAITAAFAKGAIDFNTAKQKLVGKVTDNGTLRIKNIKYKSADYSMTDPMKTTYQYADEALKVNGFLNYKPSSSVAFDTVLLVHLDQNENMRLYRIIVEFEKI